jgi:hypothetical protein
MGLLVKQTETAKITIAGTAIELPEIYGRIEFAGRADGKTLEVAVATYASKEAYKSGASVLTTNVPQGSFSVQIQDGELQTIETAHEYAKTAFEQQGFEVEIDL